MQRTQAVPTDRRTGKIPLGMMLLLGYLAYTISTELIHLTEFKEPAHPFGALMITGLPAVGYSVALVAVLGGAFYGMLRRRVWAREITVVWLIIGMAAPALDLAGFLLDPQGMTALVRGYAQQYLQDYIRNAHLLLDTTSLLTLLLDKRVLLLFLAWDFLIRWAVGLTAIPYLYRQKTFFRA